MAADWTALSAMLREAFADVQGGQDSITHLMGPEDRGFDRYRSF